MVFNDRFEAGRMLADKLSKYKKKAFVLSIPRGGVEVGYALAKQIECRLDIVISKKVPYPGQPELAIGAICNDLVSLDKQLIEVQGISDSYIKEEIDKLKTAITNRYSELTGKPEFPEIKNKTVIVTDDGIATGHTFFAAIDFVKSKKPKKVIAAVPVGPHDSLERLRKKVDELVIIDTPSHFMAVGEFYRNFEQVSDEEVKSLLKKASVNT
ncbi:phosphoribosyltransferase [Candidatus Woesearchaeota archaeon]|nr:phosphoribosyltransferase [Candidatus Woesearchaeota archaeon]|tara:strand:+ start:5511 stop:6146 length:636 start_codon:yes stop_codon:yes gene_type:complete